MNEANETTNGAPSGLAADVWALFTSPTTLFRSVRERPRFRGALVVVLVVVLLATLVTSNVLTKTMIEKAREQMKERGGNESGLAVLQNPGMRVGIIASSAVMVLVLLLVYSAVVFLMVNLSGGTEEAKPFPAIFRAAAWAKLVELPHMILWVPLVLSKGTPMVYFGPAALASEEGAGRFFGLLASLDLFNLWFMVLFALGTSVLLRISRTRAAATVFVPWVVWQAVKLVVRLP